MSDTRLADILDALYDQAILLPSFVTAIAAGDLVVSDGPPDEFSTTSMLVIGGKVSVDEDDTEITTEWDWSSMGVNGTNAEIDEWIRIPCEFATLSGDADIRTCRRTLIGYYVTFAAFVRGTTLSIPQVMWAMPQPGVMRQRQTEDGAEVFLGVTANIRTRI